MVYCLVRKLKLVVSRCCQKVCVEEWMELLQIVAAFKLSLGMAKGVIYVHHELIFPSMNVLR